MFHWLPIIDLMYLILKGILYLINELTFKKKFRYQYSTLVYQCYVLISQKNETTNIVLANQ